MRVREGRAVGLHEGCMSRHAQVGLHVRSRSPLGIEQVEDEVIRRIRCQSCRLFPHHPVSVWEHVTRAELPGGDWLWPRTGVLASKGRSGHSCRNREERCLCLRKSVAKDHICIEAVHSGGHRRKGLRESSIAVRHRMKVEDRIHLRPADRVKMHQMTVICEEVGVLHYLPPVLSRWIRIAYQEIQMIPVEP